MRVETPRYAITLGDHWTEQPSADLEQKRFYSAANGASLILSSLPLKASMRDMARIAQQIIDLRVEAERTVAAETNVSVDILKPISTERQWGYSVAYYGWDKQGRNFSFSAAITPKQVLSVYAESKRLSEENIKALMEEIMMRLEYDTSA